VANFDLGLRDALESGDVDSRQLMLIRIKQLKEFPKIKKVN